MRPSPGAPGDVWGPRRDPGPGRGGHRALRAACARPGRAADPAVPPGARSAGWSSLSPSSPHGISATVSWNAQPLGTTLTTGLSCALAVFGLGLAVSAFVGRVGPGTVICVVLTGGLLAGAAALPEDISGQVRESRWVPVSAKEVKPHYRLGSGSGELDLRETGLKKGQTLRSAVRVGAGRLKVVVPADAIVKVSADVDLGDTSFPRV